MQNISVLETKSFDGVEFEIIAYDKLSGPTNTSMAMDLFFANQVGLKMKQVRIKLNNSSIKTEAGALYYHKGNIECRSSMGGVGGLFKKAVSGSITNESAVKPTYSGTGEILLEPSFNYYMMLELNNESIIVDKGLFYCCSDGIEVKASMQKNLSSSVLGGEGLFQIELRGTGIAVLECKVPTCEIVKIDIKQGEKVQVDGNFAIARTSGVTFSVSKSDKSLFGSVMSGEGLLNTFSGEGTVWLAPTQPMYSRLRSSLPYGNNSMNNSSI